MISVDTKGEVGARNTISYVTADIADMPKAIDGATASSPDNARELAIITGRNMKSNPSWYGGLSNKEQVKALFAEGWPEGAKQALELADELRASVPEPISTRRKLRYNDNGDELNIDRALRGQWDNAWMTRKRAKTQTPRIIRLGLGIGGSAFLTAKQLAWSGAQLVALADLLEQAGYRVELHALYAGTYWEGPLYGKAVIDVLAKEADDPLRADSVAAIVGHAASFRTAIFGLIASAPVTVGASFGSVAPLVQEYAKAVDAGLAEPLDLIVPQGYNKQAAMANLRRALETLGVI